MKSSGFEKYYTKINVSFTTASLLHVGDGNEWDNTITKNREGETVDATIASVIRNKDGKPFIPGTSIAGVFSHFLQEEARKDPELEQTAKELFGQNGNEHDDTRSNVWIHNSEPFALKVNNNNTKSAPDWAETRKRTKVDLETGAGDIENRALFETAFVPKGKSSKFSIEIWASSSEKLSEYQELIKKCLKGIELGYVCFGAGTTNGSGVLNITKVLTTDEICFDSLEKFESYANESFEMERLNLDDVTVNADYYELTITGKFENAFITGGDVVEERHDSGESDVTCSLKNKAGKYLIPGSSIKGLLRHECYRILKTIGNTDYEPETVVGEMFGYASDNPEKKGKRGLIYVKDTILPDDVAEQYRNRTPIDRFIFGVIDGMLANMKPIALKSDIVIEVMYKDIQKNSNEEAEFHKKLLKLACEQVADGKIALGGMNSIGNGYFCGKVEEL